MPANRLSSNDAINGPGYRRVFLGLGLGCFDAFHHINSISRLNAHRTVVRPRLRPDAMDEDRQLWEKITPDSKARMIRMKMGPSADDCKRKKQQKKTTPRC